MFDRQELRDEIRFLGDHLGRVIRRVEGDAAFTRIESLRFLARDFRNGDTGARDRLQQTISQLTPAELRVVIRAFAVFLNLANLAEDRHRVRVLRGRERAQPDGRGESIRDAVRRLRAEGANEEVFRRLLACLDIELVLTAHPTEAKRRSVRAILRRIRHELNNLDRQLLPKQQTIATDKIMSELTLLWQTDLVRIVRPSVMQEVERGLAIKPILWKIVPRIMTDLREALQEAYPQASFSVGPFLHYGSWIGGDRDGHPGVTVGITDRAFRWMRSTAIEAHLETCERLRSAISIGERHLQNADGLKQLIRQRLDCWKPLREPVSRVPESEVARRWLMSIAWRLEQTRRGAMQNVSADGQYVHGDELRDDVARLMACLHPEIHDMLLKYEVQPWLDRIDVFGLHLARLDVRQDADVIRRVTDEIFRISGLHRQPESLDEASYLKLITDNLESQLSLDEAQLSEPACETVNLMRWLSETIWRNGSEGVGGFVISMTRDAADVMRALWLWRQFSRPKTSLPIIPLFETVVDLRHAADVMARLWKIAAYDQHLQHWQHHQTIMLGYSDGTKDGGYLSASWALFNAQTTLQDAAASAGVTLTFFHGRGGALGRGGGPAARSILSLPAKTFQGRLRLTEQGEVLAERYDDPQLAYRHLEQVVWASMLATVEPGDTVQDRWIEIMNWLADRSRETYRLLIDDPQFVEFFRRTTPIDAVEQLPIGSRPSRRSNSVGIKDLRAIPWVFSWTQCRWLVPAWYGMGQAIHELREQRPEEAAVLVEMYREWHYFQATVDNAALALVKADISIASLYGELAESRQQHLVDQLRREYEAARVAVKFVTGQPDLLTSMAWLRDSIHVRNFYIDPLNVIQVELLRRLDAGEQGGDPEDVDSLSHLLRLSVNGIASGMRTTG